MAAGAWRDRSETALAVLCSMIAGLCSLYGWKDSRDHGGGAPGPAISPWSRAGGRASVRVSGRDHVLAQAQVLEGHRAARAGHVVHVDPGLRDAAQLEAVEQAGAGVPEGTRPGVGVQELAR